MKRHYVYKYIAGKIELGIRPISVAVCGFRAPSDTPQVFTQARECVDCLNCKRTWRYFRDQFPDDNDGR